MAYPILEIDLEDDADVACYISEVAVRQILRETGVWSAKSHRPGASSGRMDMALRKALEQAMAPEEGWYVDKEFCGPEVPTWHIAYQRWQFCD